MDSFEYIDDTDCDAEDDLDWSSFESNNVATPKPHHKVFSKLVINFLNCAEQSHKMVLSYTHPPQTHNLVLIYLD